MKVNKQILLIILVLSIFIAGCQQPLCGNSELEEGEDSTTCCLDAGCIGSQTCVNNTCEEPECGECQYLENHTCKDYECCENSECSEDEKCLDNKCQEISCTGCNYIENNECKPFVCCINKDCDDNDDDTKDFCRFPATKKAKCVYEDVDECQTDEDCNDDKNSTKDTCSTGKPHTCKNIPIIHCIDDDNFCPKDCNFNNDNDCKILNCEDDVDCFNEQLDNCSFAEMTMKEFNRSDNIDMEITTYIKIVEKDDDDVCEVFFRTEDIKFEFTNRYKNDLQDDPYNYTESEVDDLEDDAKDDANDVEGNEWRCFFEAEEYDDIEDILDDWDDGYYDVMDFVDYDCDGDYF